MCVPSLSANTSGRAGERFGAASAEERGVTGRAWPGSRADGGASGFWLRRGAPQYVRGQLPSNTRKTECGARRLLVRLVVRTAPFALPSNTRKTECGARRLLVRLVVRTAPFALPSNTRKTE